MHRGDPLIHSPFYFFRSAAHQPCSIASVGHAPQHVPQSIQASASITYLPSPSEIASTGHSPAHVPQEIQASVITYAIVKYLLKNDIKYLVQMYSITKCLFIQDQYCIYFNTHTGSPPLQKRGNCIIICADTAPVLSGILPGSAPRKEK